MNYNKVFLAGNLTREPALSYLPSQTAVVDFGLAINRKWKSKGGDDKLETCFVDCVAFGKTAENINKYLNKGDPLFVEGRLKFETWKAKDNTNRSKHRIVVESFQFLKSKSEERRPEHSGGQVEGQKPDDDIPF